MTQREQPTSPPRRPDLTRALRLGAPRTARGNVYFHLVGGSWTRVMAAFACTYFGVNAVFAALYLLSPGCILGARPDSFADAFFFSVQTLSTIGYGTLAPGNDYANWLVTIEAAAGVFLVAVVTGLVFARVSQPFSAAIFSERMVVTRMHGKPVLMFRVGNARGNDVVEATVALAALIDEVTPEGHQLRRVHDLLLVRRRQPMFVLSWTVMHEINEASPLSNIDWSAPTEALVGFVATLTGHDGTYGQTTYARHIYRTGDVRAGHRLVDVLERSPDGVMKIDYARFHDTQPEAPPGPD